MNDDAIVIQGESSRMTLRGAAAELVASDRRIARHRLTQSRRAAVELGLAWQACEAALPEGWWFHGVNSAPDLSRWSAGASKSDGDLMAFGRGPSPIAALRALEAALRERP